MTHVIIRIECCLTELILTIMIPYKIDAGTGQHIGDRSEQQDRVALLAAPRAPGYMMAVLADGMGGASGGMMAAEQAIKTARQAFEDFSPLTDDIERLLHDVVNEVHTVIKLLTLASEVRPQTTFVVLVLTPDHTAIWGHVGDSRLYRFAGPNLAERTFDHTEAKDAPANRIRPGMLLNALGQNGSEPALTIGRHAGLKVGDAFLLCTDGMWRYCSDGEFGAAMAMNAPREAAQMLIDKARHRATPGNADNCTLAIVKLVAVPKVLPNFQIGKMRRAV